MFGVDPGGNPIVPRYDPLSDDPGHYALYMESRAMQWLRSFPAVPPVLEPVWKRMLDADFYDGMGSLVPLGAHWWERLKHQGYNFWLLKDVFGMFPASRLRQPDAQMQAYMDIFQLGKYPDNKVAFREYLKVRTEPPEFEIGDYLITSDGEVIDCGARVKIDQVWVNAMTPKFGGEDDGFDIL